MMASAITGHAFDEPNGVIVPRSYPVAVFASSASGSESRLTPRWVRSFGQSICRPPGTRTNT
jgi:hypothetical protein